MTARRIAVVVRETFGGWHVVAAGRELVTFRALSEAVAVLGSFRQAAGPETVLDVTWEPTTEVGRALVRAMKLGR